MTTVSFKQSCGELVDVDKSINAVLSFFTVFGKFKG